jgi:branched-chain amino acid transport system permease protein
MILQILISGLVVGSCYAVVSVGMTTLIQATTILNFAHGECVMLGAFIFFTLQTVYDLNGAAAVLLTIIAGFLIGATMERSVFRRIMFAPHVNVVLATNGFLYLFRGLARLIWKSEPKFPGPLLNIPPISFGGAIITGQDIVILFSVLVLAVLFVWVFLFTETGLKMRAAAQSIRGAALVGINTKRFFATIWGVSVGAGAIAGVLLAPMYSVHPEMGESITLRAFAAMTLGGFGNIGGAAIGGVLMGILESFAGFLIWSPLKEIVAYIVIVGVLLVRPTGILGTKQF